MKDNNDSLAFIMLIVVLVPITIPFVSLAVPFKVSVTVGNVSYTYEGWYSESIKYVELRFDDRVEGFLGETLVVDWENLKASRELSAPQGVSHSVGELYFMSEGPFLNIDVNITTWDTDFIGKVFISKNTSTTLNSTLTYTYTSAGGRAKMREEFVNGVQHSAVGTSFDVELISFKSEARLRLGEMNVSAVLTPEGVAECISVKAYTYYSIRGSGNGNMSIGVIWYWQFPDPARLFYHKESASGVFELAKTITLRLEPVIAPIEVAPAHPSAPI